MKEWSEASDDRGQRASASTPLLALVTVDDEHKMTRGAIRFAQLVGIDPDEAMGAPFAALFRDRHRTEIAHRLDELLRDRASGFVGNFWLDVFDDVDRLVEVSADCELMGEGGAILSLRDMTSLFLADLDRDAPSDLVQTGQPAVVTRWTRDLVLEYHSPTFEGLVSVPREDLLTGPGVSQCGFTEMAGHVWRQALEASIGSAGAVEFDWDTIDGSWIHSRVTPEYGADGFVTNLLVVGFDVAEQRQRYDEATMRALADPLTGLANRAAALAHIGRALERRGRTRTSDAVIHIDLDRFKAINASLGHVMGDEVLITVGKRLRRVLRPHDVVSRIAGDEFVVFLQQMPGVEEVLLVVERIRGAIREPLTIDGREIPVHASVGLAFAPERNASAAALVGDARSATKKAKLAGRDRVEMADQQLREQAEQRMKHDLALRRAMRNGEMEVHLLPEFDLMERKAIGAEALLRWNHPERGLVPAAEFIALAEDTGLLLTLGNEVMRRSCELVSGWARSHPMDGFSLRVNLSARQLAQANLVATVAEALEDSKLDPNVLTLELSEGTLMDEPDEVLPVLYRLRDLGVRLAIDDFGKGASSLAQLKNLPVDVVLIDRSFVWDIHTDARDEAIVRAIVEVTTVLGLEIAAVGIDEEEQLNKLIELGCRRGQGYFLSTVVRPNEFIRRFI